MGQEILTEHFKGNDFHIFKEKLCAETALLEKWFSKGMFEKGHKVGGFEIEAWLVGKDGSPAPINEEYLKSINSSLVVSELAAFNIELNTVPRILKGDVLKKMENELKDTWEHCSEIARNFYTNLVMVGILPTVHHSELIPKNMSNRARYHALNEQILRQRRERTLHLDINGRERLCTSHTDVMLESATTSFQIHMQVDLSCAARFYNAAHILSAPMVAVSANSPYLFGKDLWCETRIPLFEQSINNRKETSKSLHRVSFGKSYIKNSLIECFSENRDCYPALLPINFDEEESELMHLRLHNGTIWRWNRPLVGFNASGEVHLRIEHRTVAAGPSIVDSIANAALFFGMMNSLGMAKNPPEDKLPFNQAKANFYNAAKYGLDAGITWLNGEKTDVKTLLLKKLIPAAVEGLGELGIEKEDIDFYMNIISERLRTGINGAAWQRAYVEKHNSNMYSLYFNYLQRQKSGKPVHEWSL